MAFKKHPDYRINLRWYRILYFPILLPVALLLALFNKISPVPFKIYALRVERIGQMVGNQEEFLCELDLDMHPREFRVYVHRDRPCNQVVLAMQKRVLPIHQIFLPLFDVCHKLGGLGVSSMRLAKISGQDPLQLVTRTAQHFDFTPEETAEAHRQLTELGVAPDKPFIPVLGRDNSYLARLGEPTDMDSYRNVDINTFIPAMEYLADRFQVLRIGSVVKHKLETSHPNIIDYSLSGKRSELLDVYISAKCRFFISCGTGLDGIAALNFRLPVLYVNYIPPTLCTNMKPGSLMIFKKYWHTDEKRYLTLSELLETGIGNLFTPATLNPRDVVVHDNTPEEILAAAREMNERLDGTWLETDENRAMQERFWEIFKRFYPDRVYMTRVGTDFIRANREWLL